MCHYYWLCGCASLTCKVVLFLCVVLVYLESVLLSSGIARVIPTLVTNVITTHIHVCHYYLILSRFISHVMGVLY